MAVAVGVALAVTVIVALAVAVTVKLKVGVELVVAEGVALAVRVGVAVAGECEEPSPHPATKITVGITNPNTHPPNLTDFKIPVPCCRQRTINKHAAFCKLLSPVGSCEPVACAAVVAFETA